MNCPWPSLFCIRTTSETQQPGPWTLSSSKQIQEEKRRPKDRTLSSQYESCQVSINHYCSHWQREGVNNNNSSSFSDFTLPPPRHSLVFLVLQLLHFIIGAVHLNNPKNKSLSAAAGRDRNRVQWAAKSGKNNGEWRTERSELGGRNARREETYSLWGMSSSGSARINPKANISTIIFTFNHIFGIINLIRSLRSNAFMASLLPLITPTHTVHFALAQYFTLGASFPHSLWIHLSLLKHTQVCKILYLPHVELIYPNSIISRNTHIKWHSYKAADEVIPPRRRWVTLLQEKHCKMI